MAEWVGKLSNDLVRVNKVIKKVRQEVDDGIERLKLLEEERRNILDKSLDLDR